ncbi:unnamed protein product [Mytilus edulis]|uniref:Uncharacterized protein n=1 Tax=Mytilus edulis TaxID=6550 RepID=A0A8S3S4H4_MYTED|nr:unnamed protein product [Mytilus edulis]
MRTHGDQLICSHCPAKFSDRWALTEHEARHSNPLMCNVCGKKYTSRNGLSRYLRDHASSRPIECDICHQRFNDNAHFEGHRNSKHLNYKPFKCTVCSKAFAYRQSMVRHGKECQGNKSYICMECNAVFNSNRSLDQHHSGKHDQKEHTFPPHDLKFQGNIKIDNNWDQDLENKSSPIYQQKSEKVKNLIDKVYFSSDLKDVYVGNNVQGFRKGSTEAIVEIIFKNPNMIEVNVTETPPEEKLNGEKVTTTFIQIVESGTVEEAKDFQIDTHQVQFTDATLSSNVTSPTTKTTTTSTKQTTTTVPPTTTAPATTPATTTQTTTTPTTTTPMTTTPTTTTTKTTPTTTPATTTKTTTTPTTTTPTTTTPTTTTPMTTTTPITTTPTTTTQTTTTPTTTTATTTTPITTTPTTTTQTTTTPTTTTPTTTTPTTTTASTTTTPITTTPTTTTQTTTTPTTTTATTTSPTTTTTKTTTKPTTTTPTTTTPTTTTNDYHCNYYITNYYNCKTTTTSHNLTATTSIPTSTTRPITTSATTTSTTITATTTRPTTTTTPTSTAATKSSTTASNTSTTTKTIPTSATYTTSTIPTSTRLSVTTNTSVEPLVEFNVQVLMRNMTWTPAYNNTNSTEYQQLLHEVMLMEANIQKYMLSMGNSSFMLSSNGSMPVSEIFDRMIFLGIREEGIKACKIALDTRRNKEIPTNDILEMIKLVLEGNNFKLIDRDFLQNEEECEVCDIERHEEKIILGDKTFNLKKNIHGCQLVNLIYGLHCEKCNHYVYVGETERSLNERIKEHLADIRHDRDTAVAEHFNQEDHCKEDITVQTTWVPNGFQLKWKFNLDAKPEIIQKSKTVLHDASMKLLNLPINVCENKINETSITLNQLSNKLCDTDVDSYHKIKMEARNLLKNNKEEYDNRKKSKMKRIKENQLYSCNCNTDMVKNNFQKLSDHSGQIRDDDFIKMKVRGDGNCFYRYENFNLHMAHQSMTDGTLESWATEAEITAVSEMYEYTIFVKTKVDGAVTWIKYSPMNGAHDKERWIAIEHLHNHFNLLKFKQKKCVCKQIHLTTSNIQEQKNMVGNRKVQNDEIDWFDQTNMKDNSNKDIEPVTYRPEKEKKSVQENEVTNTSCPVINLSSKNLNTEHMSLLSKGLSFIPAQKKVNIGKVLADLTEWERRMRLKEYFYNIKEHEEVKEKSECSKTRRKNKDFTPKPGKNIWLDTYIEVVKGDVMNGLKQRKSINLTTKEENALKDILQDDDIVIRPADKGSGIVVINKEEYFKKLEEEITNNDTYSETEQNTTHQITKKVKSLVNRMKKEGSISGEMKTYLIPKHPHPAKLKGNPKIHKQNKPYRTIVNGIGTATEKIAEIAEKELDNYVINSPSYIRDTTDFLNKLSKVKQPIPKNSILFCFDVVKLYPSIPREEGIKACKIALDTRRNKEIPTNDILEMIKLVLEGNNFKLIDRDFLQNEATKHVKKNEVCDIERHEEKIILGDKTFNLKKNIHGCQLVNLIYGLHCEKCNHYVYVGETERSLNERIKEHLADIRHDRDTAVAEHFNQEDHCKEDITVQHDNKSYVDIFFRYMNGRVMVMFDLVFKARHMTMPDGVSMTVDSSMVRTIVSTSTGVNQMDVHIVDLGSVNSTTSGTRNSTNASTTTAAMVTASEKTTLSTTTMPPTTTPLKGSCGGNYVELMGSFASPNYPGNYPNYQSCYFYINVPSGYKITVTFTEFKTGSCCDYVKVYDGLSKGSPLLLTLMGSYYTNITVSSTANKMLVYFNSDFSAVYSGFRASYSTDIEDCSMDQIKCSSDILSPCVSIHKLCDGYPDCDNSFDEQHCHNYTRLTSTASTLSTSSWYTTVSPPSNTSSNIEIRLVNGSNCLEGRVEININGVWGTISTSSFTYREAGVICKQLGFRGQAAYPLLYGYFGQADSTVPVWYTYLYCYTGTLRLEDCSRSKYGAGNHYQDVGVSTGPCRGHDGNYYSYYMYLETDYGSIGDTAEMYTTVTFNVTPRCLSFYYHMYGSSINELQVRISSNSDTNGKVVWSKKYQQGNKWHSASVDIPALYGLQIKFVGIRGNSYRGDIGVDEVKLQRGTCDSVCPNNIDEEAGVNCTFSKRNACNYTTESIKGTGDWMYKSYSTPGKNLPPTDVSGRSFGYFFYQSSNGKEGDSTRLFSPYFTSSSSSTVRFYSYFGGRDVGSLRVSTIDDSGKTTSLWYKHGEQANGWLLSCISLKQEAELLLEFVASRSSDGDAAIAVDNVTLSEKPCMFGIAETVCDFDHPYMCGYKVNCSCTQQSHLYKWIRHTGPTASKHTGPESDSESDGYYMYAEATFGDHSDATSLKFPEFRATGSQNLQFKYHMYGNDTGTLMVQAKNKGNNSITKIWSLTGPQKNGWNQICMPLRIAAQTIVELSYVAVRGDGPIGDIAIDDVLVTEEKCPRKSYLNK